MSTLPPVRTVHVYSMHTDPFAQPGSGDAGGMNVYIARSVHAMLELDPELRVEVFTLDRGEALPADSPFRQPPQPGERIVRHSLDLPSARGLSKNELATVTDDFAQACVEHALYTPDIIHSHYWLSGQAAARASELWSAKGAGSPVPVLFTPHTTAAAKDARRGEGEAPEPEERYRAEYLMSSSASRVIVNTPLEAQQMGEYYGTDAQKLAIIPPGVDTSIFHTIPGVHPLNDTSETRCRIVFAGRPQPLKGPHLLVEALALLPSDLQVDVDIIGRSDSDYERRLLQRATELGVADRVHLKDPVPASELANIFRAADIVASPSSSETFGLVALEAQACGAAVLATDADGLRYAVENHRTGLLVAPRTPQRWAAAIERLVRAPYLRHSLGANAAARARTMGWDQTARKTLEAYAEVREGISQ